MVGLAAGGGGGGGGFAGAGLEPPPPELQPAAPMTNDVSSILITGKWFFMFIPVPDRFVLRGARLGLPPPCWARNCYKYDSFLLTFVLATGRPSGGSLMPRKR
jgi:hypothetical protein